MSILDKVETPEDIRRMRYSTLDALSKEIREFLIKKASKDGGHLASNLGVVELTIALHRVFNTPTDKIIWDVGHQSYVHKILTGRKSAFSTFKKFGGLSGFPKREESEYDCFNTGHSSTSISAGLGFARARDVLKKDYSVISVIGDGALTGGLAFEALNDAGRGNTNLIVVLNDNEMSISQNVGGMSDYLSKIRTNPKYYKLRDEVEEKIKNIPSVGSNIASAISRVKDSFKYFIISGTLFEELGFTYLGPIDGHDIKRMEEVFSRAKNMKGPIFIHVYTKKGRGYKYSEKYPSKFHSIGSFDIQSGELVNKASKVSYSKIFGNKITWLAKKDPKVICISAAMEEGTGLGSFAKEFPKRFFDVGIAEGHAVTCSAGLAASGLKPYVAIYSSFLQRAYDEIIHDVCMQNLPVVFCIDRSGLVGEDGETHHGMFDISYLAHMPNMTIFAPKDANELEKVLEKSLNYNRPLAIRYPKGEANAYTELPDNDVEFGKSEIISDGTDITIISVGSKMFGYAYKAFNILKDDGYSVRLVNARFIKPVDEECILESASKTGKIITVEDNTIIGGYGSMVLELLNNKNIKNCTTVIKAFPDTFVKQGTCDELYKLYDLDSEGIVKTAKAILKAEGNE